MLSCPSRGWGWGVEQSLLGCRELSEQGFPALAGQHLLLLLPQHSLWPGCMGTQNLRTASHVLRLPLSPEAHTYTQAHARARTPAVGPCPGAACLHPKGSLSEAEWGLLMKPWSPSPRSHAPRAAALCPGVCTSHPRRCRVWLQVKAGVSPSGVQLHTPPAGGVRVHEPQTRGQLLPLAPCPLAPQCWPLTSSLLLGVPGQLLTCFTPAVSRAACPWPPGGVPESQAGLAA